jgi:hypothetical protein
VTPFTVYWNVTALSVPFAGSNWEKLVLPGPAAEKYGSVNSTYCVIVVAFASMGAKTPSNATLAAAACKKPDRFRILHPHDGRLVPALCLAGGSASISP